MCLYGGGVKRQLVYLLTFSLMSNLAAKLHLISEWFLCNIFCIKVVTASWLARNDVLKRDTLRERNIASVKLLYQFFSCTAVFLRPPRYGYCFNMFVFFFILYCNMNLYLLPVRRFHMLYYICLQYISGVHKILFLYTM